MPIQDVSVVDDRATLGDTSDDLSSSDTPCGIVFIGGDANGNAELDPGEVWQYEAEVTAAFINGGGAELGSVSELNKYLLVGTTSNVIAKGVNVQNGDLGADIIVLSTEINDNVDFDLDDVFLNNAGSKWVDVDNAFNTAPDYLAGADNGTTEPKINNDQSCAQFVSPKINFNDVRFERCSVPEGEEEQTNVGEATGLAFGITDSVSDTQTIVVFAGP